MYWKRCFQGKYQRHVDVIVFSFATVHVTDADVTFCDSPGMLTVKAAKQVHNSTWITLLKQICAG